MFEQRSLNHCCWPVQDGPFAIYVCACSANATLSPTISYTLELLE